MTLTQITKIRGAGIHTTSNIVSHNINSSGIITAVAFKGPFTGSSNIQSGILTATKIDLNGDIDVDGHTNLDNVSISGIATVIDLDVDGHTNLDNVSIAGVATVGTLNATTFGPISGSTATFSGNVSIGGTLTYEDVTNIDSVGIITARDGLKVLAGGVNIVGVVTATGADINGDIDVDGHTNLDNVSVAGVITATSFVGGLPITNGADNRIITASSASAIQGEASLTFDGSVFYIGNSTPKLQMNDGNGRIVELIGGSTSTGPEIRTGYAGDLRIGTNSQERVRVSGITGYVGINTTGANNAPAAPLHIYGNSDTTPILAFTRSTVHDDWQGAGIGLDDEGGTYKGSLTFYTHSSSGTKNDSVTEKLRISSAGKVNVTPGGALSGNHPPGDLNIVGTNFLTMTPNDNSNASDNEVLGQISFLPYAAGSVAAASAKIEAVAESGQSGSANPTSMRFYTKPSSVGPGSSGTERLRIDSTGDVKFWGTTNANNTNKSLNLTAPSYNTSEEDVNLVQVENESGFNQISFGGGTSGLNAATTIRFLTASAVNTVTGTERLKIHADGEVEIKAAANGQTVLSCTAAYASGSTVNIQTWARSDGAVKAAMKYSHGANSMNMGTTSNHNFTLRTNDTERIRIMNGGSVNIGGDYAQTTYTMKVTGSFAATTKSFVIDHPTKENHQLRYACLEGPENSVYVRGRSLDPVIELPDYWDGLVHDDSITVNVTPIGNKNVWVESINNNSVTIGSDDSTEYFYTVFAERKDVEKLEVEVEK